jgi:hypothetical protein
MPTQHTWRFKPLDDLPAGRCAPALAALAWLRRKEEEDPRDYWIEFYDDRGPEAQAYFDLADCGYAKVTSHTNGDPQFREPGDPAVFYIAELRRGAR